MARQKPRKAFPTRKTPEPKKEPAGYLASERSGMFGFLSDRGVRETIESIVVAVILALLFRTFEAEAFVIPTGSMAPTLQGQHRDINCEQCGYLYQAGASEESSTTPANQRARITSTFCPICQFDTKMDQSNADHRSNNGDRILVNKFVYDFSEPKRFDVIVFKNPNNGKQNYIKRLVGLPLEDLIIENGDIFEYAQQPGEQPKRQIIRKPANKLRAMLQLVDDTDYIAQKLHDVGWPLRWQQWKREEGKAGWDHTVNSGKPNYVVDSTDDVSWLRYRHLIPINRLNSMLGETDDAPRYNEWQEIIEENRLPSRMQTDSPLGRLICDYYCYNHRTFRPVINQSQTQVKREIKGIYDQSKGLHWVGDLGVEFWAEVKSESGTLKIQLVEGGAKFTCSIDVESGTATLDCDHDTVSFVDADGQEVETPKASTRLKGKGKYRILFANVDDKLFLYINNRTIEFDTSMYNRSDNPVPRWFPDDQDNLGDAEPASIGAQNLNLEINRLKILRDVYYTSPKNMDDQEIANENQISKQEFEQVWRWFDKPGLWETSAKKYFADRFREDPIIYKLDENQFLPMGDNSPSSLDGRVWDGPKYVDREMLIGRALFIYWPHSLNSPVPFFPNFGKMGFIR